MRNYVIRRVLLIVPTLFIVSVLVFVSLRFIPGDVIDIMMSRTRDAFAGREALEKHLGLDVPLVVQYGRWVFGIITQGDLGTSLYGGHSPVGSSTGCPPRSSSDSSPSSSRSSSPCL